MRWTNLFTLLLGIAWAVACAMAAGWSLGAFIGPLAGSAVVGPILAADVSRRHAVAVIVLFSLGVGVVWIGGMVRNAITVPQWMAVVGLLVTVAFAFSAVARLIVLTRLPAEFAAFIAVILCLAWLTAPFWLPLNVSSSRAIGAMVAVHPVFAINAILPQFGEWTELPATYHLTNLGQDVPYSRPTSAWGAALLHGAVGCVGLLGILCRSSSKRNPVRLDEDKPLH